MKRFKIILLVLILAVGAAVVVVFGPSFIPQPLYVAAARYDVDADGEIELVRWSVGDQLVLWEWDRDGDARPELIAYDAVTTAEGGLRATGQITAWDWGGNALLDEGEVPPAVEQLLQQEDVAAARAAATAGEIALVGPEIRQLVDRFESGYDDWRLDGFRMPIVGASLPDLDTLLPSAPRPYRNGVHQGFDMNDGHIGVPTGYSAPVVAAKEGTVLRTIRDFTEMTAGEYAQAIATSLELGTTPPKILDKLRGRQIWIDHGHGVLTRYCHLSGIASEISEGKQVQAGDIIGFVGNSGTESGINGTRAGAHLHFELRIDDRYLGEGLSAEEIRAAANKIFKLDQSG